jgi:iron complex transport system substrate-binding protein
VFSLIRGGRTPVGALALVLALLLALAAACGDDGDGGGAPLSPTATRAATVAAQYQLTLTDGLGRSVTLTAVPQRIASLSPAATEILFAVGAGAQVAAVDMFSDYPSEAETREKLDAFQPSVEAIAGAQPDLVLVFYDPGNLVEGLTNANLTVFFLETPTSVEAVLEQIRLLGKVTGHPQEAEGLVESMQEDISAVQERLAAVEQGPRVFHEVDNQLYTVAPDSFVGNLYTILKAQNIAAGTGQAFPQLSQEAIIEADPEVIILGDAAGGESAETVKARPGWGSISAVKNDRIYVVDPDIVSRPGPRLVNALETLAQALYPERFP